MAPPLAHGQEIGQIRVEGAVHPHILKHIVEQDVVFGFEAGKPEIDNGLAPPFIAHDAAVLGQPLCDLAHAMSLFRQQDGHREGAVAIGQLDGLVHIVFAIVEGAPGKFHHLYFHRGAVFPGEFLGGRVPLGEFVLPLALEIERVDQIGQCEGIHFVQNGRNHPFRLFLAPIVDGAGRGFGLGKIEGLQLRIVTFVDGIAERSLEGDVLVVENGIGQGQVCFLVELGQLVEQQPEVVVDFGGFAVAVTQHPADFVRRLALGAVEQHAEGHLQAERGDEPVGLFFVAGVGVDLADKAVGKCVAVRDQGALLGGQGDGRIGVVAVAVRVNLAAAGGKKTQHAGGRHHP